MIQNYYDDTTTDCLLLFFPFFTERVAFTCGVGPSERGVHKGSHGLSNPSWPEAVPLMSFPGKMDDGDIESEGVHIV
jgi:hypothetical protein